MIKNHKILVEWEKNKKESIRYCQYIESKMKVLYRKRIVIPRFRQIAKRNPSEAINIIKKKY